MRFIDNKYFRREDTNILFVGPYMEMYVPGYYFKNNLAEEVGENFKIFGLVNIVTFNDPDGKQPNPMRLLNLPVTINTYPSEVEVRKMDLHSTEGTEPVVVMKYYTNDILCNAFMPVVTQTFKSFINLLDGGKVPAFTPYNEVFNILKKNCTIGGIHFDLPDLTYEILIAEKYRSKRNTQVKFGAVLGKDPKHDQTDYVTFSPREITKSNSTFNGIIFEDMDQMITSAINSAVTGRKERTSPMEEIIKY